MKKQVEIDKENGFKKCTKCGETGSLENFRFRVDRNYYESTCRKCSDKQIKEIKNKNKKKYQEKKREYLLNNKENKKKYDKTRLERNKEWLRNDRKENPEKYLKRERENRKKILLKCPDYYQIQYQKEKRKPEYRQKRTESDRDYRRRRRAIDADFRLLICLRSRILAALKGKCKSDRTIKLIGCSIEDFKRHIESQFKEGMNWENHGNKGWHLGHILPCCSFDLTDPEQQKICFHFSNLQPLWWHENLSKGGKLPD